MDAAFPEGSRWWWVDRIGGTVVHLSLVEAIGCVEGAPDVFVRSVRSGRRYRAGEADLLPLAAFADPTELCVRCGRRRDDHPMRHKFKTAKETT